MEQMHMGSLEDERVGLRNQMQAALAKRHGEEMMDFIDKHAKDFGDYVKTHDNILDTFKSNPEEALKEIEPLLYH